MTTVLPAYLIHWNSVEWCVSAAASILSSSGPIEPRVTVVDNGQEGGPALETRLPRSVRLIATGRNLGYAGGANVALRDWLANFPGADLAIIGSHDIQLQPDALARLVDAATRSPEFGILGPALLGPGPTSGGRWTAARAVELPPCEGEGLVERDWVSGACLLLSRRCVTALGGFDERFHSYCEDVDLGLRARAAGFKVGVVLGARARGLGSVSPVAPALCEANSVLLAAKHAGVPAAVGRLLQLATWALRAGGGSLFVWRPRARRRASAAYAFHHARAVGLVARRWALLRAMAKERSP